MKENKKELPVIGADKAMQYRVYKNDKGMYVRKAVIKSIRGGDPVHILSFADVHINYTDETDIDNDEIMLTAVHRHWNAGGISLRALTKAMEHAKAFDKTVICGDVMDYLSHGAMEMMKKYIWDADPGIIVSPGSHDITRQMQTGVQNKTPIESRYAVIETLWRHDVYYYSEVIAEKVIVIQLDNSRHMYWKQHAEKLRADIKKARDNGYIILIFEHDPIVTGNPEDSCVEAVIVCDRPVEDFYSAHVGYPDTADKITSEVYELITHNADIIRGVFCGHVHSGYYVEINGSYTDENGNTVPAKIPQYVIEGLVYNDYVGHVMEITVD